MKYLEVDYHDNDYGWPVKAALERLWGYLHENNGHLLKGKPLSSVFVSLHRAGSLVTLIERLYCLEDMAGDVEYLTRGLHFMGRFPVEWKKARIKSPGEFSHKNTYLTFKLHFRKTDKEINKWQNGEVAYLELETGKVTAP